MSTSYIVLTAVGIVLIAALVASLKIPALKKYRKYIIIGIIGFLVILIKTILSAPKKRTGEELEKAVTEIKEKIVEAQKVAEIEVAVAREKNEEKMQELKEVTAIKDSTERRKRLASMIN